MIGIENIGTYLPKRRIDNLARLTQFDTDENFITDKIGMLRLSVKNDDEETSDLCCRAFEDLVSKSGISPEEVDCIVVCTQNPDGYGLPHTSALVHAKLELKDSCAVFDISLGCSGYVYGLSIIQGFMKENGFKKGVLFTADPYSKVIDTNDKNTSLLFGDAATATLVSDSPAWSTGKFLFGSHGKMHDAIQIGNNGKLSMNGRAVFNFTATVVPKNILEMLKLNSVDIESVDIFAFHQASRYVINIIAHKLKINHEKVPYVASEYGNTVSSSIPMILANIIDLYDRIVIAGFGVGLSWGSTVLTSVNRRK